MIKIYNHPHKESCLEFDKEFKETTSNSAIKSDKEYLEKLIRSDPLKPPKFFKNEAIRNYRFFNIQDINNTLDKVRKEIFPSEPEILFSNAYCFTKANNKDKSSNYLQSRLIFFEQNKDSIDRNEIVIFGSKFFIKILA